MAHVEIPNELPAILRNFALSVLRTKPHDIIDHAVDYFTQLQEQKSHLITDDNRLTTVPFTFSSSIMHHDRKLQTPPQKVNLSENTTMIDNNKLIIEKENLVKNSPNITINSVSSMSSSTGSELSEEEGVSNTNDGKLHDYLKKNECRRVSVAAERYNPEDDDSDDEQHHIYPKTPEQRQRLKEAVCHNLLFRTLETKQIDQILDAMWEKHVQKGECIIRQGDDGDHFYVIDKGTYEVYVSHVDDCNNQAVKIGVYNQAGSFGELALMYNQPRSATVIATTDGIVWVMGRQTFRKLVLKHAFRKRQMYENFLRGLDILQSLNDYERSKIADALIPIDYYQNDLIIKQGDDGDRMFFIEDGQCDVYRNEKFHKRLNEGDYFGELALLNHEPRSATVIAASFKVRLASLEVQSFERLLGPCMDIIHRNTSKYIK